jgi:pimeloyl-ACP methyl ester carboxylesterase
VTRRDLARFALAGAALLVATVVLRTVPLAWRDLHPRRRPLTGSDRAEARRALPGAETVEFRTDDGLSLRGWFAPGRDGSAVVLVHGLGGDRAELLPEASLLLRHGHAVLVFDSRASGESEGTLATWGDQERWDVVAALRLVRAQPGIDRARVGLYGFSVGASTAALVAAVDPSVRAVALGPVWPSLDAELHQRFQIRRGRSAMLAELVFWAAGAHVDAVRPVDVLPGIPPRPLLLISGTRDDDTPSELVDGLAARVPGALRWNVPGAGHGKFSEVDPAGLEVTLGGFFDRALSIERRSGR